jgi:hypothetical protein
MGVWDKYKLDLLPEEQRAEAIKELIKEKEQTERSKLDSNGYQVIRGFLIVALLGAIIAFSLVVNNWVDSQKEVKLKTITPMVCPMPPPCPAAPLPKFDIKIVPIASVEEKKNESDAGTQ